MLEQRARGRDAGGSRRSHLGLAAILLLILSGCVVEPARIAGRSPPEAMATRAGAVIGKSAKPPAIVAANHAGPAAAKKPGPVPASATVVRQALASPPKRTRGAWAGTAGPPAYDASGDPLGNGAGAALTRVKVNALRSRGSTCPESIYRLAWASAEQFHIEPLLVVSIIEIESACRHLAVSGTGAQGLMQLMPGQGAREAYRYIHARDEVPDVQMLRTPQANVELGVAYLAALRSHYFFIKSARARLVLAIAAYNCGPGFLDTRLPAAARTWEAQEMARWIVRIAPAETRSYIAAVLDRTSRYALAVYAAPADQLRSGIRPHAQ